MTLVLRRTTRAALATLLLAVATVDAYAQDVLIRNATVHTATARGTLQATDVLVRNGRIAAIGQGLAADGVVVVDAAQAPLTPALFGGIGGVGLEDVSIEEATMDSALSLGDGAKDVVVRPEFDVTRAYNPASIVVPVTRVEGIGFALLPAGSKPGGSIVGGQGGVVRLDGGHEVIGPKALFVSLGGSFSALSGSSRAGQWMLLDQLLDEARGRIPSDSAFSLLTPAGRTALKHYLDGKGRVFVSVDRAADILELLGWARSNGIAIAIQGGAEAWQVAPQLAAAGVPVFVDGLANLPADFDQIAATLENAARLHAAGVRVSFAQGVYAAHSARKIRQHAGNAVANGLPWESGLAGLTRIPAEILGVSDRIGSIEVGKVADLTLWSGDPLDVAHTASQVWFAGKAIPMRSYQTELRDRYLPNRLPASSGGLPRAYPTQPD